MQQDTPPDRFLLQGVYFDGQTAMAQPVDALVDPAAATLTLCDAASPSLTALAVWDLARLRRLPAAPAEVGATLRPDAEKTARLIIPSAADTRRLSAVAPSLEAPDCAPDTAPRRQIALWAACALTTVALMLVVLLPRLADTLAHTVAPRTEAALGRMVVTRTAWLSTLAAPHSLCSTPDGQAALNTLTARLTDGLDLPYPVQIHVANSPMVNAIAAPGGHILLFSGLLAHVQNADELAAVIAHELGHVAARDPLRHLLRSAGSAGLVSLALGEYSGSAAITMAARRLFSASYTRTTEAGADRFAHDLLHRQHLPTDALARFFDSLNRTHGDLPGVLHAFANHPALSSRAAAARAAPDPATLRPALGDADWAALRHICTSPP